MKPYYEHAGITIYHGDCREVLPGLGSFDLVLTDPPYGIAKVWGGGAGHGWGKARKQTSTRNEWDDKPPDKELLSAIVGKAASAVIWGGNYFELPPSRGWLVWNKPERNFSLAEAELAWTNTDTVIRVFDCPRSDPGRQHPTQKPERLMHWCLSRYPKAKTVLDPFMGSGTTLVVAKNAGLSATGIELREEYIEMAINRLSQEVLFSATSLVVGGAQ